MPEKIQEQLDNVQKSLRSLTECKDIVVQNTKEAKQVRLSCEQTLMTIKGEFNKVKQAIDKLPSGYEKNDYVEEIKLIEAQIKQLEEYFATLKGLKIPTLADDKAASNFDNENIFGGADSDDRKYLTGLQTKIELPKDDVNKTNTIVSTIRSRTKKTEVPKKDLDIQNLSKANLQTILDELNKVDVAKFEKRNQGAREMFLNKQKDNISQAIKKIEEQEEKMLIISSDAYKKAFDDYTKNMERSLQIESELKTLRDQEKQYRIEQAMIDVAITKLGDANATISASTQNVDGTTKTLTNAELIAKLKQTDKIAFVPPIDIEIDGKKYQLKGTKAWYDEQIRKITEGYIDEATGKKINGIKDLNTEQENLIKSGGLIEQNMGNMQREYKQAILDHFEKQKNAMKKKKEELDKEIENISKDIAAIKGDKDTSGTILYMEDQYIKAVDQYLKDYPTNPNAKRPTIDPGYEQKNKELNTKIEAKAQKEIESLQLYQAGLEDEYRIYDGASSWIEQEVSKLRNNVNDLRSTNIALGGADGRGGEIGALQAQIDKATKTSEKIYLKEQQEQLIKTYNNNKAKIALLEKNIRDLLAEQKQYKLKKNFIGLLILDTQQAIQTKQKNLAIDKAKIKFDEANVQLTQLRKLQEQFAKDADENTIYLKKIQEKAGEKATYTQAEQERIKNNKQKIENFEKTIQNMSYQQLGAEAQKYESIISEKSKAAQAVENEIKEKTKITDEQTDIMNKLQLEILSIEQKRLAYQVKAENIKMYMNETLDGDDKTNFVPYVVDIRGTKEKKE